MQYLFFQQRGQKRKYRGQASKGRGSPRCEGVLSQFKSICPQGFSPTDAWTQWEGGNPVLQAHTLAPTDLISIPG